MIEMRGRHVLSHMRAGHQRLGAWFHNLVSDRFFFCFVYETLLFRLPALRSDGISGYGGRSKLRCPTT
jgi:hypothetical protein